MISPRALVRQRRIAPLPRATRPQWRLPAAWRHLGWRQVLWLLCWAPWWFGNELPPPSAPGHREPDMAQPPDGTAGTWLLDTLDDLRFRFGLSWALALLLRGAWLGGIVGIGWLALAIVTTLPTPSPLQLAVPIGIGMALGLVLRLVHRPGYHAIALMLERSLGLRSRLSTAVIGLRHAAPDQGELHHLQLADAANTLDAARARLRPNHWVPVRELFIAFIVALTLLLLLVARRPEGEIPALATTGVPHFVPVSERLAAQEQQPDVPENAPDPATLEEVEDISRTSNQAREDLETIGDALDGHAQTSPAASAIASENYPAANQRLSDAANAVSQLPADKRESLARDLDEAASQVSDSNPELAQAAQRAATDVRAGKDTGALDRLGDHIEQTGDAVVPGRTSGARLGESPSGQGDQQGNAPGGNSSSPQNQPKPADQQSGQTQPASTGNPGAGMRASGGVGSAANDNQQTGDNPSGTGQQGGDAASAGTGQRPSGDQSPGTSSQSAGTSGSGEASDASEGGSGGMTGRPDEEGENAAQGTGAGSGQRHADDANEPADSAETGGDLNNDNRAPEANQGRASDNPPPGGAGDDTGDQQTTVASGGSTIMLPGSSDERVSAGPQVGSSSLGSGGGVGAASGNATSNVSGSSGPDPNAVPARWRQIVEDYFRNGGAP